MNKVFSIIGWCVFLSFAGLNNISAQTGLDDKGKKKYQKVKELFKKKENEKAFKELEKFQEEYPDYIDAYIKKGSVLVEEKRWEEAIQAYEEVLEIDSDYHDERLWYTMAYAKRQMMDFDGAMNDMDIVLKKLRPDSRVRAQMELERKQLDFIKDAFNNPVPFDPIKLDTAINTADNESQPVFNADGSRIYFTRKKRGNQYVENLYSASFDGEFFSRPRPIEAINTSYDEGSTTITPDGNFMIFSSNDRTTSKGSNDLYLSMRKNGEWSKPVNLGSKFNSPSSEIQPSISTDSKTIFFTSNREGGKGKRDIWYVTTDERGKYMQAQNLGDVINTRGNDESPFLHPDGKTLYFRSDGHVGMGDYDIFYSKKDDNGNWTTPVNMGYPINTENDEGALFVNLEGTTAYFSSDADTSNVTFDIYKFELPENLRPEPTTFLKAKVIDAVSKIPLSAKLEIINLETGNKFSSLTDMNTGIVLNALPAGEEYSVNISSPGYLFYSKNINLSDSKSSVEPYLLQIELEKIPEVKESTAPVKETRPVVLENIFFETGSANLLASSMTEINKLYYLLRNNTDSNVRITGHTDNVGSDESNMRLSEQRAKAVYDELVKLGIDATRMTYEGKGETQPIEDNDNEAGRKKNRRTEFVLISK